MLSFNQNIIIAERIDDNIVLYDRFKDRIFTLTSKEYDTLENVVESEKSIIDYHNEPNILIVEKAYELNILTDLEYAAIEKNKLTYQEQTTFYLIFISIAKRLKIKRLSLLMKKSKFLYRVAEFNLQNTLIDKLHNSILFPIVISSLLLIFVFFLTTNTDILNSHKIHTIALFVVFGSCLHEYGHYCIYKIFKGDLSYICFGVLHRVFPVFYMKFFSIYIWSNVSKIKNVAVYLGGSLIDILLIGILTFTTPPYASHIYKNIVLFKLLFNLNPLIRGTDGYYILMELYPNSLSFFKNKFSLIGIKIFSTLIYLWLFITLLLFESITI